MNEGYRVRLAGVVIGVCTKPDNDRIARIQIHVPLLCKALPDPPLDSPTARINAAYALAGFDILEGMKDEVVRANCVAVKTQSAILNGSTIMVVGVTLLPVSIDVEGKVLAGDTPGKPSE